MNRKIGEEKVDSLKMIKTPKELHKSLFEIYYQQWIKVRFSFVGTGKKPLFILME